MTSTPAVLNVHPHFNAEEAAQTATEFVASLDNLPGEVSFLLEEIREKDTRINQLLSRINSRHQGLTRHLRNLLSNPNSGTTTPTFQLPLPAGSELPTSHLSNKDAQAVIKIQGEWGKIEVLQEEKIKLAERMERIVNRARERGKAEWRKVGGMDPDEIEAAENKVLLGDMGSAEVVLPPTGLGTGSDRPFKKRKPNALPLPLPSFTQPIVHPPSSMPPPPAPVRTALPSRRKHERQPSASTISEPDADGEGEMEAAEAGDTEADDTLYCLCQQKSYGEMIGCDNDKCEYEWFHVKCVNISGALPDTWYCPDCVKKLGYISSDGRVAGRPDKKGRKR
ncbi:hypothetical protein JCM24511_02758 [Saitozyma sp. JCM 24511]|nr:hypothetical protein JCM24511_02758 [Saitozyma sp. JCM 24511]